MIYIQMIPEDKIRRRDFQKKSNVVFIQPCWIGIFEIPMW